MPKRIFVSYSSRDEILRKELDTHLALLKREGVVETWTFRDIEAGDDWRSSIDAQMESADIILLLVSADFIASDYCWNVEMKRALQRHREGEALVVPIMLRDCDWTSAPFAGIQALPAGAKPVASWRPKDKAWTNVVEALRRLATANVASSGREEPLAMQAETIAQRARRLASDSAARKAREEKIRNQGHAAYRSELLRLFQRLDAVTTEIASDPEGIRVESGHDEEYSIVRLRPLSDKVYPLTLHCYRSYSGYEVEEQSVVARLLFGGMVLPQERNIAYPDRPKEHAKREYKFRLSAAGQWQWLDPEAGTLIESDDLANALISGLLQLYDDAESGKTKLPSLW